MSAALATARILVSQLKTFERRVRSEEQPTFAELHDLFDTMRTLDRQLEEVGQLRATCAGPSGCPIEGTEEVIPGSGKRHCPFHANQLRALLGQKSEKAS